MLPGKQNDLVFKGPIQRWDEAIPLGNGLCGCLLWGNGETLRLSLDHGNLWETTACPGIQTEDFRYETMLQMVQSRRWDELNRLFDKPYSYPYPTKLPAGKLLLELGQCNGMEARLSLDDAAAAIKLDLEDGPLTIRTFLHAEKQAGFLLLNRLPEHFSFRVECPAYSFGAEKKLPDKTMDSLTTCGLSSFTYPEPKRISQPDTDGFILTISDTLSYAILARLFHTEEGELLVWQMIASSAPELMDEPLLTRLAELGQEGYTHNFESHRSWWHQYWSKSGIRISEPLFEQNWYLAHYLLSSCSRKGAPPMPLQGVWTADDGTLPPWKGDYHHDLNTQLSYYSYLKANHLEQGECFLDYLWELLPAAREFAHSFYRAEGICLTTVMSIDGQPLCGWPMYSLSPTSQLWLCQLFERHYRFTGDQDFLRQRAYPYLKESARFILCLLQEGADGYLRLPLSSSPEIHDATPEAWLTPNSNYDLALLRYLFRQLVDLAPAVCPEDFDQWSAVLNKLPDLAMNERGAYRISPDEDLAESHRHLSHLMALHPLRLTPYDTPEHQAVIDACVNDLELLGSGLWVGFSFTWMAELYALQGNGEGAAAQLELFWRYLCSSNGFHLNGDYKKGGFTTWHYRPFTLEGTMCAADALQEMLLFSEMDTISLFPAVPSRFEAVEFENLRAQNGLLVSARMENGKIISASLHATQACQIILKNGAAIPLELSGRPFTRLPDMGENLRICFD